MFAIDPVTALLVILFCLFLIKKFNEPKDNLFKNFPPGPKPLPIIGNMHLLNLKRPYKTFLEFSKKYGPVFSVQIGSQKMVLLCGYETVKDALVNYAEEFSERPFVPIFHEISKGNGVLFAHGENWKVMRRFTISTLRNLGMGKKTIENKINEESDFLVTKLKSYGGKPFESTMIMNAAVANIIVSLIFGYRFDYGDPVFLRLISLVNENVRLVGSPMVMLYNTFKSIISWFPGSHKKVKENAEETQKIIKETLTRLKEKLDINDQRTIIDAFLVKQQEEKSEYASYFHNENLTMVVSNLFIAGMDTTSTTLRWGLLLMIKYPEIQRNVQNEIEKVIGSSKPQSEHQKKMPYTDAIVHEIQRFANIIPTNLPHATTQDVTFKGYVIPKGTYVLPLLSSVLRDEAHFEKPNEFYPEHFLDSKGNFMKNEVFLPFSAELAFSMDLFTVFLSIVVIVILTVVFKNQNQGNCKNFPPGPKPLPILGNVLMIDMSKPHKSFLELSKTYGPVLTVQLGLKKIVVLCGYETIKDALINHADIFSNRPHEPVTDKILKNYGVVFSNGENWKVMRRFTVATLRDYGMGKKSMENRIIEEAECLVQRFKSYKGKPFDNFTSINCAVANIIVGLLLSHRYDYEDPTILKIIHSVNENIRLMGSTWIALYNSFPLLMDWLPGAHRTIFRNMRAFQQFVRATFTKQKKELDVNDQQNLIDTFLAKQQEGKPESTEYYHNDNLIVLVANLFAAGMDTTATTLRWGLLLMMKYPEIQQKVQDEIERVIGSAKPQIEHRKQMPYTDAVIHEIQRFGDIIPNNVPHATSEDYTYRGYFISKGTLVMPLLHSVHRDKTYYEKPYEFYPEHFLDSIGNFKKNEAFLPFSIGKRNCAGETLAKTELFLFFTTLLQNFTFHAPPGAKLDLEPALGFTSAPRTYEICAISRT